MLKILGWIRDGISRKVTNMTPTMNVTLPPPVPLIDHYLNDPTTPELVKKVPHSSGTKGPPFSVRGYNPKESVTGSLSGRAANCHVTISENMDLVQGYLGEVIQRWAATANLNVDPEAGEQFNAYYDRAGLRFFYGTDPKTKKVIYCSEAADVVSHELGHAILDAIRPELWNVHTLEIWAFHEAFGDCMSMLHFLSHTEAVEYLFQTTGGDLTKSNSLSRIAEELGTALHNVSGGANGSVAGYLRDAVNYFNYIQPEKLPSKSRVDELSAEPHNFSRVFSGSWYDILIGIFEQEKKAGKEPIVALSIARDVSAKYLLGAVKIAPANPRFFQAIAQSMITCDRSNQSKYKVILNRVFSQRKIIIPEIPMMMMMDYHLNQIQNGIDGIERIVTQMGDTTSVRSTKTHTVQSEIIQGMAYNPLYGLKIDVPGDDYFEYDAEGSLITMITTTHDDIMSAMHGCLDLLDKLNYVSGDPHTPFEIQDGKLVRTHFACGFGNIAESNAANPEAPEYGKAWKPENNCGCGPCLKPKEHPAKQAIKRGCVVRYNACRTASIRSCSTASIRTC
jgi:hypothetical protein